ncbi:MAG: FecR family protein [Alkalispirochaeta sp.]
MNQLVPRRLAMACIAFLGISLSVHSQSDPYAFVIYAEGYNMSIYRNDELLTYDVLVDNVIGMPLLPGDLVQTDPDTFVEIQVMPSRTVVKVAENTTFEIESLGGSGGGTFDMSYGRVRARVERLTNNETFRVRGSSAVAGVRGTDFGYDMVVEREAAEQLRTRVYVFDGEVAVSSRDDSPEGASEAREDSEEGAVQRQQPEEILIGANEMVNVVSAVPEELSGERDEDTEEPLSPPQAVRPQTVSFQREPIQEDIQQFWRDQDFREEAIDPAEVENVFPGINARVQRLSDEQRQYEELQRLRREGLLGSPDSLLSDATEDYEPLEPEREPEPVALSEPGPNERIRRLVQPDTAPSRSKQLRRAGHWFMGTGLLLEAAGIAGAWYLDDIRDYRELDQSTPGVAAMAGGGVFLTSGIISYFFSLFGGE